jgi:hypothetical protein
MTRGRGALFSLAKSPAGQEKSFAPPSRRNGRRSGEIDAQFDIDEDDEDRDDDDEEDDEDDY